MRFYTKWRNLTEKSVALPREPSIKVFFLSVSRVREREMALSTLIYVKLDYKVPQLILEMSRNKNGRSA